MFGPDDVVMNDLESGFTLVCRFPQFNPHGWVLQFIGEEYLQRSESIMIHLVHQMPEVGSFAV